MVDTKSLKIADEHDIDPSLNLEDEINRLRESMNAVILAHYYQDSEIQELADFVGDSLDLSRKAAATDADVIVFCGVTFMADVAKILNPTKTVLIPDTDAGCSLEFSCRPEALKAFKEQNPDHIVLTYINSSAEVKALSDIIVTSSNAEYIINQIPKEQPIIFAPDKYLGGYLNRKTGRDMLLWEGSCIVHERFSEKELVKLKTIHPDAKIIAHPECPESLLAYADHIGSTSSLINFTKTNNGSEFIVLTEPGIIHQMEKESAQSKFYDVPGTQEGACASCNECPYMRLNTLEKLYMCMVNKSPAISITEQLRLAAKKPLDKMLEMSPPKK
ncbi:MAG: quinolinate synthase [Alphaproteobacteria bacterium CG11_big_fil_rev_8_21_14_0_20_39_49]|nr:MAG: quinolinate synthase [Alphaproteobacteria bacterium CG11_big_fil_rev_8_21_14_0_20_39_49]